MIVIIGGMIRSGSTFSFNIVRELLERQGKVKYASENSIEQSILDNPNKYSFILKTHIPDANIKRLIKAGELPCICTIRTAEDAILSWMRAFDFSIEHGIAELKSWFSWYRTVENQVLTLDYEIIDNQPRLAIQEIIDFLGIKAEEQLISKLEKKYNRLSIQEKYNNLAKTEKTTDLGFSFFDNETFFHRKHITSLDPQLAQVELDPTQIRKIRYELREFLE